MMNGGVCGQCSCVALEGKQFDFVPMLQTWLLGGIVNAIYSYMLITVEFIKG